MAIMFFLLFSSFFFSSFHDVMSQFAKCNSLTIYLIFSFLCYFALDSQKCFALPVIVKW